MKAICLKSQKNEFKINVDLGPETDGSIQRKKIWKRLLLPGDAFAWIPNQECLHHVCNQDHAASKSETIKAKIKTDPRPNLQMHDVPELQKLCRLLQFDK